MTVTEATTSTTSTTTTPTTTTSTTGSITTPVASNFASWNFGDVSRVSVKVPLFWPKEPALWFAQIEAQFSLNNITQDSTKYHYVVANLDANNASEVKDVITNPPEQGKYERIKSELIARSSISAEQRIRRLLEGEKLGGRKPSQFLRHLRNLGGTAVNDTLLRTLWLSRLPVNAQAILTTQSEASLDNAAVLADKICEVVRPQVAAVNQLSTNEDLRQEIEALRQQVSKLVNAGDSRGRSRSQSRSRSRQEGVCWYHNRFGDNANKCTPPCKFSSENSKADR